MQLQDKYMEFCQKTDSLFSPLLRGLQPVFQEIAKHKVIYFWLLVSLPSSIFTFLITTRLFGELSGDYNLASSFAICTAIYSFLFTNYIRKRQTTISPEAIGSLKEALAQTESTAGASTTTGSIQDQPDWLNDFSANKTKGLILFRRELEMTIRRKLEQAQPENNFEKLTLGKLIEELATANICSSILVSDLRRIKWPLNSAVHGRDVSDEDAEVIARMGQVILELLEGDR